jgi:AraC-like DNA-binding protein
MVAMSASAPCPVREPWASTRIVHELVIALEHEGVPRQRYLQAAQCPHELVDASDGRVPLRDLYSMLETALSITGDPAFGLHWGEKLNGRSFSVLTYLFAQAASLRQAFELLFEFGELLSDWLGIELSECGEEAEVRCAQTTHLPLPVRRLVAEFAITGLLRMILEACPPRTVRRVCFDYSAPSYRAEYASAFDAQVFFEQPFSGVVFDRDMLDVPSEHADEDVHDALRTVAEQRLSLLRQGSAYSHRVQALLTQQSAPQRVPMSTVASRLKISERSLYRHIADEGTSYRALVEASAASVAKRMLQRERRTIQETAYLMGFSEVTAFHRAFKRWTGTTPHRFRASCHLGATSARGL